MTWLSSLDTVLNYCTVLRYAGHMTLTDTDRQLVTQAREIGPELRASTSDRDRLAGWLLKELADLAERLAGQCPACGHKAHPETPGECGRCPEGYCEATL